MTTTTLQQDIEKIEEEMMEKKKQLSKLRQQLAPEPLKDYSFKDFNEKQIILSELFGEKEELILIHNMGKACAYCTLWADGFNGIQHHLDNRASFVVISKDAPNIQKEFYESRSWKFKMYSSHENTFNRDMGFETEEGDQQPGVSVFVKDETGAIFRHTKTYFGPGDNYCIAWDLFDLLPKGSNNWHPKYKYS